MGHFSVSNSQRLSPAINLADEFDALVQVFIPDSALDSRPALS
jgi:hypothetical protein